jgi:hypothetical protein
MKPQNPIVWVTTLLLFFGMLVACAKTTDSPVVTVSERKILVNNQPYLIKGVCYHPVPKGSDQRSFEKLTQDLALMVEAGINTIRVYSPIDDKAVLDEIAAAGIKVIMGFGYNQEGNFDILSGSFINYINTYKNHNAILLWELGNEYNYHPEWFNGDIKNWYSALNNAADLIHQTDKNHPVATAHGELPDSLALALTGNIDVWGINIYRWDKPESFFPQWSALSTKPMYFSEAGTDSYMTVATDVYAQGINEAAQAEATKKILNEVFKATEICSGVTLYAFVDEWWKAGNNDTQDPGGWAPNSTGVPYDGTPNEEFWGILTLDSSKKKAYDVVKDIYTTLPKTK